MNKDLIKQWGENTAYSAKSHFKTADLFKLFTKLLILINILFAAFSLLDFSIPVIAKIFGVISLIASVLLFISLMQEGENVVIKHMKIGDEYLNLHNELQRLFHSKTPIEEDIDVMSKKIAKITQKNKPIINQFAKRLAKKAIEKKGEMTTWWKG